MFKKNLKEIYLRTGHIVKFKCGEFGIIDRNTERVLLSNGNYESLYPFDRYTLSCIGANSFDYEIEQVYIGTVYSDNPAGEVEDLTLVWDRATYEKQIIFEAIMDGSFRTMLSECENDEISWKGETTHDGRPCLEWDCKDGTLYRFYTDMSRSEDEADDEKWSHICMTNQELMDIIIIHTGYERA